MGPSILSVYFDGKLENLPSVSALVADVCRRLALDDTTSYQVELAVVEAVTNGIRHAFGDRTIRPMHLEAKMVDDERLLISVSDRGEPVELDLPPTGTGKAPVPDELADGGRGLFLMCSLMDQVEHLSDARGNTLLMTKVLQRA